MIDLIYVGFNKPNKENFTPVKNLDCWTKPQEDGGFWTSPMENNGKSSWQNWLENQNHHSLDELKHWHIIMEPETRILEADMMLHNIRPYLRKSHGMPMPYIIDYEKMSKDYDFLYVPKEVQERHRMGVFMGFDVETGLFLNPTFEALDDKEYEVFKQQYEQHQKEDEKLLKDPSVQKILLDLNNNKISEDKAQSLLMQKIKEIRGR
ncbi:MAG: hypothetical protein J6Y53_04440 [Alphaproteobacteria bacterium]|nr:hypothetical protein [Alphaproteobacteria bacterium]